MNPTENIKNPVMNRRNTPRKKINPPDNPTNSTVDQRNTPTQISVDHYYFFY